MASALIRGLHQYKADREARIPRPAQIDVAICVADMKTARRIKRSTAVITPKNWQGSAVLHVLVGNGSDFEDEYRVFLASLRLFNPHDLDIVYPHEMEIGWSQEPTPSKSPDSSS